MAGKNQPLDGWKLSDLNKEEVSDRLDSLDEKSYSLVTYSLVLAELTSNQSNVNMEVLSGYTMLGHIAKGVGTITGMMISFDSATSGANATFTPRLNGSSLTSYVTIVTTGTQNIYVPMDVALVQYNHISCRVTSASGFSPRVVTVMFYVKYNN